MTDDRLARRAHIGREFPVRFSDSATGLAVGPLQNLIAMGTGLGTIAVANRRRLALGDVELRFHLRGGVVEARHRFFVQFPGRAAFHLALFDDLVDRLEEKLPHDEVIDDEDRDDREQR